MSDGKAFVCVNWKVSGKNVLEINEDFSIIIKSPQRIRAVVALIECGFVRSSFSPKPDYVQFKPQVIQHIITPEDGHVNVRNM